MTTDRREFLLGLGAVVAAPAIVPFHSLMRLPRVPFVRTPSGLWVRLLRAGEIVDNFIPARANVELNGKAQVFFDVDHLTHFDHVIVGRDECELFYTDARYNGRSVCMLDGDSAKIELSLSLI